MVSRRWLLSLPLLLACTEERPGAISEPGTPLLRHPGAGGDQGSSVGAPRDPASGTFLAVGDKLQPDLAWQGYSPDSNELGVLSLADFHDPTGALGIRALLITEGQADCAPCVAEAKDLAAKMSGPWKDKGIRVLQLLVSDAKGNPASSATALAWRSKTKAAWPVGLDPGFTFAQIGHNPFPIQVVIDPRTLTIVARIEGYRAELPEVEVLAEKNL
ncbi:MAG: hypothetical protein RMJ98_16805 [Myxococcales bacterium]|nr:hypothetical protein [Polyangiaceae bacterium]MDW8250956.1 hypothetical protein [Myxococcales bacterium]